MAFGGDIAVPAGEQADVVFVANGDADIAGTVNTLTVIDGNATLRAATVEHVFIISGSLALEDGSTVLGDVRSIESTVTQAEGTEIAGDVKGVDAELIALGAFLGPALLLFAIGLLLASLVAGLLLVAVGTRQVRAAEQVIAAEPLKVFGTGLFAAIRIPILAIVAIVTIVGAPLGLGVLLGALPLLAFVGFLVGGIFLGEELLGTRKEPAAARPYRGALLGIVLLQVIGLVPFVGGLAPPSRASSVSGRSCFSVGAPSVERAPARLRRRRALPRRSAPDAVSPGIATVPGRYASPVAATARWTEVGDRVFVRRYAFYDQNIGVVLGRDAALVIDTRTTYPQAREILDDLRELTSAPVEVVVDTHGHYDHAFGNAVFRPATIWGHVGCGPFMARTGDARRPQLVAELPDLADDLHEVVVDPPDRTFEDQAVVDVGDRQVELRYLGRGHTDHDAIVLVPGTGVVFAGDLLENGAVPSFGDSYPLEWPATVDRLTPLVERIAVPGHGDPGGPDGSRSRPRPCTASRTSGGGSRPVRSASTRRSRRTRTRPFLPRMSGVRCGGPRPRRGAS